MDLKLKQALAAASVTQDQLDDTPRRAFPLGNGSMTCLLMGNGKGFTFNLTKSDVWDKRLITEDDADIVTDADLRKEAMSLKPGEHTLLVNGESNDSITGKPDSYDRPYPCPVICARLSIESDMHSSSHRLDLLTATVESDLRSGPVRFYISHEYDLLFVEGINETSFAELLPVKHIDMEPPVHLQRDGCDILLQRMPADADTEEYYYAVGLHRASSTRLVAGIVSDSDGERAISRVSRALRLHGIDRSVYDRHVKAWESYWERCFIDMDDKLLEGVWYRNNYALGCIARSGCASPGLFISLSSDNPMWHGDYHTNYNYQAIFWGAFASNHCELADVYDDTVIAYHKRAKWLAGRVWGVDGAFYPHVLFYGEPDDPAACRSKNGRQFFHNVWGRTLGVSAMTVQNLLFHWYYDPDPKLLNKIYPVLRDSADFFVNLGDLREAVTVSPEHWGITPQLRLNRECTFDITLIKYLMRGCIAAADALGCDGEKREAWQKYLDCIPDYPTGGGESDNTEFAGIHCERRIFVDIRNAPPRVYNIPAPILPVFPGCDIDLSSSPAEQELARDSIKYMTTNGNNDFVMGAVARIRMRSEDMYSYLLRRTAAQQMPSGFLAMCADPDNVFNTFGVYTEMLGITLAISELMLQSNKGLIRLFPAMPDGQNGRFRDMLAEGGVLVSAEKVDGRVVSASFRPKYAGTVNVCLPEGAEPRVICDGEEVPVREWLDEGGERIVSFEGVPGGSYSLAL